MKERIRRKSPESEILRIGVDLTRFFQRKVINLSRFLFNRYLFNPLFRICKKKTQEVVFQLRTGGKNKILNCPVRGSLAALSYDSVGVFTEEYHRVEIVKQLLKNGFSQHYMNFHHKIQIGHGGKNSFIPDLVIRNKNKEGYFLVLEVKKNPSKMKEALLYQLNPAVRILNARYGVYYDGSKKGSCFRHDGTKIGDFKFPPGIPTWCCEEWKHS